MLSNLKQILHQTPYCSCFLHPCCLFSTGEQELGNTLSFKSGLSPPVNHALATDPAVLALGTEQHRIRQAHRKVRHLNLTLRLLICTQNMPLFWEVFHLQRQHLSACCSIFNAVLKIFSFIITCQWIMQYKFIKFTAN